MVFVRLVVLLFLVFYSYTTGLSTSATAGGERSLMMEVVFYVALLALYLLPIYEAAKRRHPRIVLISLLDIFLGWTIIGWIAALVWAVRVPDVALASDEPENENDPYVVVAEPSRYPANSAAESLKELAKLRAEGAISEDEYVAAKQRVLTTR